MKELVKSIPGAVTAFRWLKRTVSQFAGKSQPPTQQVIEVVDPNVVFRKIYESNHWGSNESASGTGSELEQTATIRAEIAALCQRLGVKRILDVPCGDFNWMQHTNLDGIAYIGADIVPELIAKVKKKFGSEARDFQVINLCTDRVPKVDLVFCRDCLVHLSNSAVREALINILESGSTWLLTTTFTNRTENVDISTGNWRTINFKVVPFNFPEPEVCIVEGCTEHGGDYADKSLALYDLKKIEEHIRGLRF